MTFKNIIKNKWILGLLFFAVYAFLINWKVSQAVISDIRLGNSHRYYYTNNDVKEFSLIGSNKIGERNGSSKLKEYQVLEINTLLNNNVSVKVIMNIFNIGKSTVLRIKNKQSWKHILPTLL